MTSARKKELATRPFASIDPLAMRRINENRCPTCNKPVGQFRDELSKNNMSGMCQACQDSVFGGK